MANKKRAVRNKLDFKNRNHYKLDLKKKNKIIVNSGKCDGK